LIALYFEGFNIFEKFLLDNLDNVQINKYRSVTCPCCTFLVLTPSSSSPLNAKYALGVLHSDKHYFSILQTFERRTDSPAVDITSKLLPEGIYIRDCNAAASSNNKSSKKKRTLDKVYVGDPCDVRDGSGTAKQPPPTAAKKLLGAFVRKPDLTADDVTNFQPTKADADSGIFPCTTGSILACSELIMLCAENVALNEPFNSADPDTDVVMKDSTEQVPVSCSARAKSAAGATDITMRRASDRIAKKAKRLGPPGF
jgi:hypothetical protein